MLEPSEHLDDAEEKPVLPDSSIHADPLHSHPGAKTTETKGLVIIIASLVGVVVLVSSVAIGVVAWNAMKEHAEISRIEEAKREREAEEREKARLAAALKEQQKEEQQALAAEAERLRLQEEERRRQEAERRAALRGALTVETNPSGATVTVGDQVSTSPAKFGALTLGRHQVIIEKPRFERIIKYVDITENKITEMETVELVRETGKISIVSKPPGATVFLGDEKIGTTPLLLDQELTGKVRFLLTRRGFLPTGVDGEITAEERLNLEVQLEKRPGPAAGKIWQNDMGMEFRPVAGLGVLFSAYETTVKDFELFVQETGHDATQGMRSLKDGDWGQHGHDWRNPGFEQAATHPVVGVSWEDAKAFCDWLTRRDREMGVLSENQSYRLPTDAEWSIAVGLRESERGSPADKNGVVDDRFAWGSRWPPPEEFGNYAGIEVEHSNWPQTWQVLRQHRDSFRRTSPVGSFSRGRNGLYDMCGNVLEWCEDPYEFGSVWRVLRGASWGTNKEEDLLLSRRDFYGPKDRFSLIGFRCVVVY